MVLDILDLYKKTCEDLLGIPVIKGLKSESEKFPDCMYTTALLSVIPANGKGTKVAVSHNLGQYYAKKYGIYYHNNKKAKELAWQTSWGFSFRSIGIMILMHGDNKGLILPPKISALHLVIIPVYHRLDEKDKIQKRCKELELYFSKYPEIHIKIDDRKEVLPQIRHSYWEVKGVPLRAELTMKEYNENSLLIIRRDNDCKITAKITELQKIIQNELENMQITLFTKAKKNMSESIMNCKTWEQCSYYFVQKKACIAPWCRSADCEKKMKAQTAELCKKLDPFGLPAFPGIVKVLLIPFDVEPVNSGDRCIVCLKQAHCLALWGISY